LNAEMARPIRLSAFAMNTVGHQSPGLWAHPRDRSARYTQLEHWVELARLLERGLFDTLFLADVLGVYDVYRGSKEAALRHAVQVPVNDPLVLAAALATATEQLGLALTFSLSYEHPYPFARRMSTLDHLTGGRVAWNIVTGYLNSAARNFGVGQQLGHDERYELAEEYLEVLYKLWEHSWEEGAVLRDRLSRTFVDPGRVHEIAHAGRFFDVPGIHLSEPSPQRTPVLFQAGTSERGVRFAARHAECVFTSAPSQGILERAVRSIRSATAEAGRQPADVLIYGQALLIVDETEDRARAKHRDYLEHVDLDAALALLSGWTGVDFAQQPLDSEVAQVDTDAGRTALASFSSADPSRRWSVREAARFVGLGGRGPVFVGSASQVADELESWVEATGIDGFNLASAVVPETFEGVVGLLVPELQRRGRYPLGYGSGTLREKLFGRTARLPDNHAARRVRI
jgi:long-chain alkane monooxygenase